MSDDTSTQAVEELIGKLPEGVEVPPDVLAEARAVPVYVNPLSVIDIEPPPSCVICGEHRILSKTGRCPKCKSKRMPNNTARISAARAKLNTSFTSIEETLEAKNAEIAALRAALNNAQPLTFSDFKERVTVMRNAGVESYEDRGVRIVMKADISTKRTAALPLIE